MKRKTAPPNFSATNASTHNDGVILVLAVGIIVLGALLTWFFFSRPARTAAPLVIPQIPERSTEPRELPDVPVRSTPPPVRTASLMIVGDIMLGRYVETLMQRHGPTYPFENLRGLLDGHDLVIGNLEGPIDSTHSQTPDDSLIFSFEERIAQVLRDQGFSTLSLANNHTLNQGASELAFTRNTLTAVGIESFGDPTTSGEDTILTKTVNGHTIVLFGFHATTSGFDLDKAVALVEEHCVDTTSACIAIPHWGNEYQLTSSARQQSIAHALIDAGVDAILGHHPHVVQEVEVYRDRAIFYSLGNFIFDQYFSTETQQELAVRMTLTNESVTYDLLPLVSKQSQPERMDADASAVFLNALAGRSGASIQEAVRAGQLVLVR